MVNKKGKRKRGVDYPALPEWYNGPIEDPEDYWRATEKNSYQDRGQIGVPPEYNWHRYSENIAAQTHLREKDFKVTNKDPYIRWVYFRELDRKRTFRKFHTETRFLYKIYTHLQAAGRATPLQVAYVSAVDEAESGSKRKIVFTDRNRFLDLLENCDEDIRPFTIRERKYLQRRQCELIIGVLQGEDDLWELEEKTIAAAEKPHATLKEKAIGRWFAGLKEEERVTPWRKYRDEIAAEYREDIAELEELSEVDLALRVLPGVAAEDQREMQLKVLKRWLKRSQDRWAGSIWTKKAKAMKGDERNWETCMREFGVLDDWWLEMEDKLRPYTNDEGIEYLRKMHWSFTKRPPPDNPAFPIHMWRTILNTERLEIDKVERTFLRRRLDAAKTTLAKLPPAPKVVDKYCLDIVTAMLETISFEDGEEMKAVDDLDGLGGSMEDAHLDVE